VNAVFLSVVLPCQNQEDHIEDVLLSYRPALEQLRQPFEVVVVPNACTDRTPEIVRRVAANDSSIRVVESPYGGWGRSVLAGLAVAAGEVLCYTNSARTDPQHIPLLVDRYLASRPCVAKVRRVRRGAFARELGSQLYNLEARLLFGIGAHDVNGTPKVLARETLDRLHLTSTGDLLDLELLAKAGRAGLPVVEVVVPGFRRHGGTSSTNLRSAWRMYAGAVSLWWRI
jgi:glycosyltransferase involved in cell wall biosynthesis